MFTNFLKVTLRNLYREKMYAIINISGLSLAIACCLILGLYLRSELTYDRHNTKHKQIYRVENEFIINGKVIPSALTSPFLGPMLTEKYAEVKGSVRFRGLPDIKYLVRHEDKTFYWELIYYASDNVFDVFTHDIIYGDPKTALVDPNSMAVSESFARKYFGDANPIGKTITANGNVKKITLVFADLPENSHLRYPALFSFNDKQMPGADYNLATNPGALWDIVDFTYLLMPEAYNISDFKDISNSFFNNYMAEQAQRLNDTWHCWLQPMADVHYNSKLLYDLPVGNKFYIYGFLMVAIFIILVACINYMNLSTARATKRAKEVGMRKILGSGRTWLSLQFTGEAIFFSFIAMVLGSALVELTLNLTPINDLLGKALTLDLIHEPGLIMWILVFSLVLGLMSGIYPALYLSSILPLSALEGSDKTGSKGVRLRGLLVLIQFTISVCVIACTLLMFIQMRYVSNKPLGFDKENRLIIPLRSGDLIEKMPTIKNELLKNNGILGMALCIPQIHLPARITPEIDNKDNVPERLSVNFMFVGNDFIDVMGMELIAGRDFSKEPPQTDGNFPYIVNETVVNKMGWDQPLGKGIQAFEGDRNGKVIGVVKDFHNESLKNEINPFILGLTRVPQNLPPETTGYYLFVNIEGKEISRTLDFLEENFHEFDPEHPFEFEFLSDSLDKLYLSEERLMKLTGIFATVCIIVSCMGLFGLAAFTTEQRTKEIGVRKVLGASTWKIISMLSRRILLLVLCGAVIGSLIAYYVMDEWLTSFAYHTGINPMVFLLSAVIAASIAFITVALQSYKTARANPVEALRYE